MIKGFTYFVLILFFTQTSFAATARLFSLYRTNYYPEKTMVYDLEYDQSTCRVTERQPVSVYFVATNSGGKLSGFSPQNRDYFNAREISSPSASTLNFTFKAVNELESKVQSQLTFQVSLQMKNSKCEIKTNFLKNGSNFVQALRKVDVNFNLTQMPGLGEQPSGINWVKFIGQQSKCLMGKCK